MASDDIVYLKNISDSDITIGSLNFVMNETKNVFRLRELFTEENSSLLIEHLSNNRLVATNSIGIPLTLQQCVGDIQNMCKVVKETGLDYTDNYKNWYKEMGNYLTNAVVMHLRQFDFTGKTRDMEGVFDYMQDVFDSMQCGMLEVSKIKLERILADGDTEFLSNMRLTLYKDSLSNIMKV